jgi:RNA polymerase sigma-70 factor (ECF subfamily)
MLQLYRAALRMLGIPHDAEEALQDGLLCAIRHLGELEGQSRFSTRLTHIMVNASLMRLPKNRREAFTSMDQKLDPDDLTWADKLTDFRPNPEETCVWRERFQMFEGKLRMLPAGYRSVFWLRDVHPTARPPQRCGLASRSEQRFRIRAFLPASTL